VSWNVGDDEWRADPAAAPAPGPVDPLDERAIRALSAAEPRPAAEPTGNIPTLVAGPIAVPFEQPAGLPPPPYSAAFDADDADGYSSSYESGSFVAGQESSSAEPQEPEPDFHIPMLSLGAVTPEPEPEPAVAVSEPAVAASEPAAFVIPTLSAPPAAEPAVAESVYDDDDNAMVIPELVERIDSAELELEPDPTPSESHAEAVVEPASSFVIPTLARAEAAGEETPTEQDGLPTDDDDDVPVLGITPAEILMPLLARSGAEPEAPVSQPIIETEVEASAEVEAADIESLDAADLEEVEQQVAVASAVEVEEPRPPAPPEAKQQGKRRKAWYDDVFGEHFLFLYPLTWEETCQRDVQFIFGQLGGREGLTVLDVGCGEGSHAVELAKLGARVTGLDNSLALLLAAAQTKEAAAIEEGRVEFIHGDMRRLPRDREFDAVMCVGTTLGYFEEEQNWMCLQEMHDRLVPGGRLLIHVFNRDFVAPHLPSRSWWQGKRCMVIDEAEMNFFANRLRVHRTIIFDDGRQYEHYMFMRAYTVQDLGKAISQLGMRVIEVSGSRDTRGRFFGSASPDIWITAEKK
jgi:SAM-dependent methyltransferase